MCSVRNFVICVLIVTALVLTVALRAFAAGEQMGFCSEIVNGNCNGSSPMGGAGDGLCWGDTGATTPCPAAGFPATCSACTGAPIVNKKICVKVQKVSPYTICDPEIAPQIPCGDTKDGTCGKDERNACVCDTSQGHVLEACKFNNCKGNI